MTLVVDASVALKWYIDEPQAQAADKILAAPERIVAPELILAEVCNAAWKAFRRGHIDAWQQARIAAEIVDALDSLVRLTVLVRRASSMACELDHPVYDCFYLALSEMEAAPLVTADRRLLAKVAGTPLGSRTVELTRFASSG